MRMFDDKFVARVHLDRDANTNDGTYEILDPDGEVVDPAPMFTEIDVSLRPNEVALFRAEMYADHLDFSVTCTVGTVSAFTDDELLAELKRRKVERGTIAQMVTGWLKRVSIS